MDEFHARSLATTKHALYRMLLADAASRLELEPAEAKLILDACNGLHLLTEIDGSGGLLGQHLRLEVQDSISLNQLDTKWHVDGRSLVRRLRDLPRTLSGAVETWVSEFWGGEYNDETFEREHIALLTGRPR
jgi:hypothetical protein